MTVASTTDRIDYPGAGSVGPFTFPFRILAAADLRVVKRSAGGAETLLTLTTHYTISGVGNATGSVTLVTALASGETLLLRRAPSLVQPTDIESGGPFFPSTHQTVFDRLMMQIQSVYDRAKRSISLRETLDPADFDAEFTPTAGQALFVNEDGDGFETRELDTASAVALPGAGRTVGSLTSYLSNNAVFNAKDYGATGNGVTDDTDAVNAWIAAAVAAVCPVLLLPPGTYLVTEAIHFDLPNQATLIWQGDMVSTVEGAVSAVRIGPTGTNRFWYNIDGVSVRRTSVDLTGSVGVELLNFTSSKVRIRRVQGFTDGLKCNATQGNGGFSYNEVSVGFLHDNKRNMVCTASGDGYCNECVFIGGTMNHSSSFPDYTGTYNLRVEHHATHPLNNLRFIGPSFEDGHATPIAAFIDGQSIYILHPRVENVVSGPNYKIIFGANSLECDVDGISTGLTETNFTDLGSTNSFRFRKGRYMRAQADETGAVLTLQSSATSGGRAWRALNTSDDEVNWADCNGVQFANDRMYAENGFRWRTSDGELNDRGLFVGAGSPEGVVPAAAGSLYFNTSGGAGTTMYVKESGGGTTGWVAK